MPISKQEYALEVKRLEDTLRGIRKKISSLGMELYEDEEKVLEFKKFLWDSHTEMDPAEMKVMRSDNDVEIAIMMNRGSYLQKLYRIQNKPYFGSIIFCDEEEEEQNIYIGITHVEDNLNYYVHDWRSPICSLFYDYELGNASYDAPSGVVKGMIQRKRQYTIEDAKLLHIFDNEVNIDDELLQEVLATESSDKMKNIVNTIQKEQNQVIRNTKDKNLVVQGIAGSGKTSVALHRIAFLLYKIEGLNSNHILIFSPNKVFSQYISNVLPELGEENTKETSIHDFLFSYLRGFKEIESFSTFIEEYYRGNNPHYELTKYKLSDEIANDMEQYIEDLVQNTYFTEDIITRDITILKDELNQLLRVRYAHFPLFRRLEVIAEKLCDWNYQGKYQKKSSVLKMLYQNLSIPKDYLGLYNQFFGSRFSKMMVGEKQILTKKRIKYEDATIFIYMMSLLEGLHYNTDIRQVVIDEAQDYTMTQYKLLFRIFKNSDFTILGDVHQTINPYYKHDSLRKIQEMLPQSRYVELLKTYRSSEEIIAYTNRILNLQHVSAIRRNQKRKVLLRNQVMDIVESMVGDVLFLQKEFQSIAIITKTLDETEKLYHLLKDQIKITKLDQDSTHYQRDLVILPAYIAKGLEYDAVIIYTDVDNRYQEKEKYLFYVACTRAQHQLIVYHQG